MTAKEYLSQAFRLDMRINSKIELVSSLNDLARKCTSTITGMPHNPNKGNDSMATAVVKIIDLQEEINRDIDRLVDLKADITRTIKKLPNPEHQILLEQRYLIYEKWEQIALDMGYSIQHIFRMHDAAVLEIEMLRVNESEC